MWAGKGDDLSLPFQELEALLADAAQQDNLGIVNSCHTLVHHDINTAIIYDNIL